MMQGVPVVGANSAGTAEIIEDEVSGLLYPAGDIGALTRQLRRLVQDRDLRQRLGANALKRAAQFNSADREMRPLLDVLSSLCNDFNPSRPLGEILGVQYPKKWDLRGRGRVFCRRWKRRIKHLMRQAS
jgi:hypothetical protein